MQRVFSVQTILGAIFLLGLFLAGCSGGSDPIAPVTDSNQAAVEIQSNRYTLGCWTAVVAPDGSSIEAVPLRTADFLLNINKFLEMAPGSFWFEDIEAPDFMATGHLAVTISIVHPLPGLSEYGIFDTWFVFLHNGSAMLNHDGLTYADETGPDSAVLLNPDGFTRWYNYDEFNGAGFPILKYYPGQFSNLPDPSATLNPYMIYSDGLGATDDYYQWITFPGNADDRGIFSSTFEVHSRRLELAFPMSGGSPVLEFQYAVIANWEPGDPTLTGDPIEYEPFDFPTSANVEEPFFIHSNADESSLYYVDPAENGGSFVADVEIFDWQGGIAGGNGIPEEIYSLTIEGDFLPSGMDSVTFDKTELNAAAGPGSLNSSVFQIEIANCSPQSNDDALYWVIVEADGLKGDTYYQGFDVDYPEGTRRASFMYGHALVGSESPNTPPTITGIHDDTPDDPYRNPVTSDDSAVTYTVDFDDPDAGDTHTIIWWIVEEGNTPGPSDEVTQPVDWSVYSVGDYEIYVEVDDGMDADTESFPISVVPATIYYNLVITIERDTNDLILGIVLDWDDNPGITEYNIYRQDPFDAGDDWVLIPDSPVTASEYTDYDIVGNEGYQYRIIALLGSDEATDTSVEGYALLENAEDNVNTDSPWDHCTTSMYYPGLQFGEFAPFDQTPHNGTYCWDQGGQQNQGYSQPGGYNTSTATLMATPILPLPDGANTCHVEFMVRLNNLPSPTFRQCGTEVGVTNYILDDDYNPFIPSQDCIDGVAYNLDHVEGFSDYGTFPNIDTSNDAGHGLQYPSNSDVHYVYSKFSVPDVFTVTDARVALAFACANSAGGTAHPNPGTSFDDIAVLIF